jgi:hypothetical protein
MQDANRKEIANYRAWNPTRVDDLICMALDEFKLNANDQTKHHKLQSIKEIKAYDINTAYVYGHSLAPNNQEITMKHHVIHDNNTYVIFGDGGHMDVRGSMRMTRIKQVGTNKVANTFNDKFGGWSGYVFENKGDDKLKLAD